MRLAGVLDQDEAEPVRHLRERSHVGHLAVQMDGDDEPRPVGDGLGDQSRIEVVIGLARVDGDRDSARLMDGSEGRDECIGRDDHLVARLDPRGQQCEPEGVEPARHPDAVRRPAVRGEALLELRYLRPVVETRRLEEFGNIGQDCFVQGSAARAEVDERNFRVEARRWPNHVGAQEGLSASTATGAWRV